MFLPVVIMVRYTDVRKEEFTTHSLNYVALLCPFDLHHLLTNLEYWLKETVSEYRLRLN